MVDTPILEQFFEDRLGIIIGVGDRFPAMKCTRPPTRCGIVRFPLCQKHATYHIQVKRAFSQDVHSSRQI